VDGDPSRSPPPLRRCWWRGVRPGRAEAPRHSRRVLGRRPVPRARHV